MAGKVTITIVDTVGPNGEQGVDCDAHFVPEIKKGEETNAQMLACIAMAAVKEALDRCADPDGDLQVTIEGD
jgi:hypothetical protein